MVLTLFALGGAQCALPAVIALKTQKNEKNFLKKVQICPIQDGIESLEFSEAGGEIENFERKVRNILGGGGIKFL